MEKISKIDSPISSKFKNGILSKFCYIDSGDTYDTIKYTDSYKIDQILTNTYKFDSDFDSSRFITAKGTPRVDDEFWTNHRTEVKIGRFIKKFFSNITDKEVEEFVNKWKSIDEKGSFEIWNSSDIITGYQSTNYAYDEGHGSNPLMNSCMNDQTDLIDFYTHCPAARLLVLLNEDNHILGRALVWTDYKNRIIMDRVYYIHDGDYYRFITYAKENGWFYKENNKSGQSTFVKDGKDASLQTKVKVTNVFNWSHEHGDLFPYMDTFLYASGEWAMNYEPDTKYYKLVDVDGSYEENSGLYDVDGDPVEDDEDYIHSNEQDGLVYKNSSIHIEYDASGYSGYDYDDWVEKSYVENKRNGFIKSNMDSKWYKERHCVWSDRENSWIYRPDAIYNDGDWSYWDNFNPVGK